MLKNIPDFIIIGAHKINIEATTEDEFEKWWNDGEPKPKAREDDEFEVLG